MSDNEKTEAAIEVGDSQTGRHVHTDIMAKTLPPVSHDADLWKNTLPHVRILSPEDGCWEVDITERRTDIGRAPDSVLHLPYKSVSRHHARILREEGSYFIEDLSSCGGTQVNGRVIPVKKLMMLQHLDSIQISRVIMQFRRDQRHVNNGQQHMSFSRIPSGGVSGVELRVRNIHCSPASVFGMGDTLLVGKGGGLSLPLAQSLAPEYVVELEMAYPDGRWVRVLCELVIVNTIQGVAVNCLKLHKVAQQEYDEIIRGSKRDNWMQPLSLGSFL